MKIDKSRVRLFMAEQKLTNKAVAKRIGMHANNLSAVLNRGSCNPVTAARIAEGLGIHVSEIVKKD